MRSLSKLLLALLFYGAALAPAQTIPPGTFKHIIIVVQENRTPDNLFGSSPSSGLCGSEDPFEPGVDIENGGYGYVPQPPPKVLPQYELICNTSLPLSAWDPNLQRPKIVDPAHSYEGWGLDYDGGKLDGFCHEYSDYLIYGSTCPSYSFVAKSDVQPYFDIATNYGWANYMFQTNEGPSFPAHQFLFTGTSAPVAPKDSNNYYLDFVGENVHYDTSGCPYTGKNGWPGWVEPDGTPINDPRSSKKIATPTTASSPMPLTATTVTIATGDWLAGRTTRRRQGLSGTLQRPFRKSVIRRTISTTSPKPAALSTEAKSGPATSFSRTPLATLTRRSLTTFTTAT